MTDYIKARDAAANGWAISDESKNSRGRHRYAVTHYKKGADWGKQWGQFHSPEVLALVEAIKQLLKDNVSEFHSRVCEQSRGCHCKESWFTNEALAAWQAAKDVAK